MEAYKIIKKYITDNGIKQNYVADRAGIPETLLSRSLDGRRKLQADEFIAICGVLSLDLKDFNRISA